MKCTISLKKLESIMIMILLLMIEWLVIKPYIDGAVQNPDLALKKVSILCVISVIVEVILWWRLSNECFSPYIVFFIVLFIFTCGQSIGWATGLDMGGKDMWYRVDHGTNLSLLTKGLSYSMMGVTSFHLGAVFYFDNIKNHQKKNDWSAEYVTQIYRSLGKLLLCIVVPAFFAKTAFDVLAVMDGGYNGFYSANKTRSTLMSVVSILSDYYQPCLLVLFIGNRNNKLIRRFIVAAMLIDVVFSLYIGGRSGAVMTLLGILLAYHYFVKPFNIKQMTLGMVAGYFGICFLNGLASIRGISNRGLSDMIGVIFLSTPNVIGDFVGELGWTITSVCWTMNLVPSSYPFRHGMSYLVSFISWVPSVIFGGRAKNPVVIWGNLSDWLYNALHMSYGPGYTTVAESYINFGWYGLIALAVEGYIVAWLIARVRRQNVESDILGATFQMLVIMIVMKSIVRSSLSVAMRSCVFVLIPLYLLLYYYLKIGGRLK